MPGHKLTSCIMFQTIPCYSFWILLFAQIRKYWIAKSPKLRWFLRRMVTRIITELSNIWWNQNQICRSLTMAIPYLYIGYFHQCRYKMVSQYTWPNYRGGNDKSGCKVILDEQGYGDDVQYGKTKIFIKSPQTVFGLEESRSKLLPGIVIFLQKVGF